MVQARALLRVVVLVACWPVVLVLLWSVLCAKVVLAVGALLGLPLCSSSAGAPAPAPAAAQQQQPGEHLAPEQHQRLPALVVATPSAATAADAETAAAPDLPTPLRRWLQSPEPCLPPEVACCTDPHNAIDACSPASAPGSPGGIGGPLSPFSCSSSGGLRLLRRGRGGSLPGTSVASTSRQRSSSGGGASGSGAGNAGGAGSPLSAARRANSVCSSGGRSAPPGVPGGIRRGPRAGAMYARLRDRVAALRAAQASLRAEQAALETERARIEESGFHREAAVMQQRLDLLSARRSLDTRTAELAMRLNALDEAWQDLMEREATSIERQRQLAAQAAAVEAARTMLEEQEAEIAAREAAVESLHGVIAALMARLDGGEGGAGVSDDAADSGSPSSISAVAAAAADEDSAGSAVVGDSDAVAQLPAAVAPLRLPDDLISRMRAAPPSAKRAGALSSRQGSGVGRAGALGTVREVPLGPRSPQPPAPLSPTPAAAKAVTPVPELSA